MTGVTGSTNAPKNIIVYLHGMGTMDPEKLAKKAARISRDLTREGVANIKWINARWGEVTDSDQTTFLDSLGADYTSGSGGSKSPHVTEAHRLIVENFGDAVAYTRIDHRWANPTNLSRQMRNVFRDALREAVDGAGPSDRIIVLAESLGGVIARDLLRDIERASGNAAVLSLNEDGGGHEEIDSAKTALATNADKYKGLYADQLITVGTIVSVYALRWGLKDFTSVVQGTPWLNISYETDFFGYPLAHIHEAYENAPRFEEFRLSHNVGWRRIPICIVRAIRTIPCRVLRLSIDIGEGAAAHGHYFSDRRVARKIAQTINAL